MRKLYEPMITIFFAVDCPLFDRLLKTVKPTTATRNTSTREADILIQRLTFMLHYLAYGNGFEDLRFFLAMSTAQ
jgi:hypothetical protein